MKEFELYIFVKSAFIPKNFSIFENSTIRKLDSLLPIGEVEVIRNFSKISSGFIEPPRDVLEEMINQQKNQSDVFVIEIKKIYAENRNIAFEKARKNVDLILDIISTYQKNKGEIFSYIIRENFEPYGVYCYLLGPRYRKITNLPVAADNLILNEQYSFALTNEKFRLFLKLYSDATKEFNPPYHLVKIWSLLETMAEYVKTGNKEEKVRQLFIDHKYSVEQLDNSIDLIKFMYKCRNSIVHEGDISLQKLGKNQKELDPLIAEFSKYVEKIDHSTHFIIRHYNFY